MKILLHSQNVLDSQESIGSDLCNSSVPTEKCKNHLLLLQRLTGESERGISYDFSKLDDR